MPVMVCNAHHGAGCICHRVVLEYAMKQNEAMKEKEAALLQIDDLRKAAEIGAKNMKLWIQEGCGCIDGHVCGLGRLRRELETVEKTLCDNRKGE